MNTFTDENTRTNEIRCQKCTRGSGAARKDRLYMTKPDDQSDDRVSLDMIEERNNSPLEQNPAKEVENRRRITIDREKHRRGWTRQTGREKKWINHRPKEKKSKIDWERREP